MYAEDDQGNVVLTLSRDDFENLLLALGNATGAVSRDRTHFMRLIALTNRINEGNPHFSPYDIPAEGEPGGLNCRK